MSKEVRSIEAKKAEKNPENPDFPDPDLEFRIFVHQVALGGKSYTCSQNFRALATVVPEILGSLTIVIYWMPY